MCWREETLSDKGRTYKIFFSTTRFQETGPGRGTGVPFMLPGGRLQVMADLLCERLHHSVADFRAAAIRRMDRTRYSLGHNFLGKTEAAQQSQICHVEGNCKQDDKGGQLLVRHVTHLSAEAGLRQSFLFSKQIRSTLRKHQGPRQRPLTQLH